MASISMTTSPTDLEVLGRPEIVAEGNTIKGNLIRSRRDYLDRHHGEAAVKQLAAGLSEKGRQYLLTPPIAAGWYDYAPLVEVDAAIVRGPMKGDISLMKAFGAEIAVADLNTLYKLLFKLGTPSFIMKRANMAYQQYIRRGAFSTPEVTDKSARIVLEGGGHPRYMCGYGMAGWLEAALRLSGARDPSVRHVACRHDGSPTCDYECSWR